MLKEQISGPAMSDSAASYLLDRLVEMALEIGQNRFHGVILKAIETCERRPVLATFRRLAGLNPRLDSNAELLAAAWRFVTGICRKNVGRDSNGNAVLQSRVHRVKDGYLVEDPVPEIPEGIRVTVSSMGGWGALADAYPDWWNQRWMTFKELYSPMPGDAEAFESASDGANGTALTTK